MRRVLMAGIQRTGIAALFMMMTGMLPAQPVAKKTTALFASDSSISIQLIGNIKALLKDRGDSSSYHETRLMYNNDTIVIKAKTRGKFRKDANNCMLPPLLLNLPKDALDKNSLFYKQNKLKLVLPCKQGNYVAREELVYKAYALVAPIAFQTRLVTVLLTDKDIPAKLNAPLTGILIEDDEALAKRFSLMPVEEAKLTPINVAADSYFSMVLFQYMIGNTDWSVEYEHNIALVGKPAQRPYVVPFDFDQCGLVDAPYASPPQELPIQTVHERLYRGICHPEWPVFVQVVQRFLQQEKNIRAVFAESKSVDAAFKKMTSQYLDDFFAQLKQEKTMAAIFASNCNAEQRRLIKDFPH